MGNNPRHTLILCRNKFYNLMCISMYFTSLLDECYFVNQLCNTNHHFIPRKLAFTCNSFNIYDFTQNESHHVEKLCFHISWLNKTIQGATIYIYILSFILFIYDKNHEVMERHSSDDGIGYQNMKWPFSHK